MASMRQVDAHDVTPSPIGVQIKPKLFSPAVGQEENLGVGVPQLS